jgi:cytoskeletal protein CcmA (bactofilin family)
MGGWKSTGPGKFYFILKRNDMLGKNGSAKPNKNADTNGVGSLNLIGTGTVIRGDVETAGDIRIDGTLIGKLSAKARVVLGESAIIEGNIFCQNADVSGAILGNIVVDELLTLKSTGRMHGDVITRKLVIEAGADFTGNCKMGENGGKQPAESKKQTQLTEA